MVVMRRLESHDREGARRRGAPSVAAHDQAGAAIEMDAVAVDQIQHLGVTDRPATPGAQPPLATRASIAGLAPRSRTIASASRLAVSATAISSAIIRSPFKNPF
jgi:hypothetical protein